jgi:prefoldin subunit 5
LANAARYETEKDSKITFKELFEKLESDIAEIDKRILEVQTIATPSNKEIVDPVLDYLKGSQELLRALLLKSRKLLAVRSASDWTDRAIQDLRTSGYYGYEYAKRASDNALKDFQKATDEYNGSIADVSMAARNMKAAHSKVAALLPADVLADPAIFDAIEKKNVPESKPSNTDSKKN